LVVSARTDTSEKIGLISKGAEDVIHKPFDKEELLVKIQKILEREWDGERQLTKLFDQTTQEYEKNIMKKLERLIVKRISDPHLSVLDLADEMAASERKAYRLIKKISGLTPYELIKEVRWQYLDNYIKDHPINTTTEACQLIGMSNVSSFASQYEKRFGKSLKEVISNG
jgi:methylphosphotriester-DNA--protein-cysteine methyltransferase